MTINELQAMTKPQLTQWAKDNDYHVLKSTSKKQIIQQVEQRQRFIRLNNQMANRPSRGIL